MHEQAYACICINMYAYAGTCVFEHICVCVHVFICVCGHVLVCGYVFACVYLHVCICMHEHVSICLFHKLQSVNCVVYKLALLVQLAMYKGEAYISTSPLLPHISIQYVIL